MSKSICFITGALGNAGGQERYLTNLANEFAEKGHQISIVCLFRSDVFFDIHESIKIVMPNYKRVPGYNPKEAKRRNRFNSKYIYALKLIPYIRQSIIGINPDTVVSFGDWFNAYVVVASTFLKKPVYLTNSMGPNLHFGKMMELSNKYLYPRATALIVQTNRARSIMLKKYKIKDIRVVPNGIMPKNISKRKDTKTIITVGRLNKEKGHSILLESFSKIRDKSWKLDIVGHGPERDSLERQVVNLGIQNRVTFYGYRVNFDELLADASIFVLPSFYEGFPNALIEAMSVPLTCVSSDCIAGPREIIRHGENGFLFETGNVDALTIILDDLISDPSRLRSYEKSAVKVVDEFNFQRVAEQFLNEILT